MKPYLLVLSLAVIPEVIFAQQTDPCAGLVGSAFGQCRADQQKLQQRQLEQQQKQLQEQQERQSQLAEQQRQMQLQLEDMRLQNALLQKQLEQDKSANQTSRVSANSNASELKSWKSENPWFGTDYAKTDFAMRYARQLEQKRPDLIGRPFLDTVSAKVNDRFGAGR